MKINKRFGYTEEDLIRLVPISRNIPEVARALGATEKRIRDSDLYQSIKAKIKTMKLDTSHFKKDSNLLQDLTGQKFQMLTVLGPTRNVKYKNATKVEWECLCDCGNKTWLTGSLLKFKIKSCGCQKYAKPSGSCFKDFSGKDIGNVTVTNESKLEIINNKEIKIWKCICKCGNEVWFKSQKFGQKKYPINCGCLFQLDPGESCYRYLFKDYKIKAQDRKLDFQLTFDEFKKLVSSNCYYCGAEPLKVIGKESARKIRMKGSIKYNGIDRLENKTGYLINNSVSCCHICNRAKFQMSESDFKIWIFKVADYLRKQSNEN